MTSQIRKKYKRLSLAYGIDLSPDFSNQNLREKMNKFKKHNGKNKKRKEIWIPSGHIKNRLSKNIKDRNLKNFNFF